MRMPRTVVLRSDQAQFHAPGFGDHGLIPCGLPDQVHGGLVHAVQHEDFLAGICGDGWTHAAAGGGECHFYIHHGGAVLVLFHEAVVNQAEIDDVDWNFRIKNHLQLSPYGFLQRAFDRDFRCFRHGTGLYAQGVYIFFVDACQSGLGRDGIGAAQRLGDDYRGSARQNDRVAAGDLDGVAVAKERDFSGV